MKKGSCVRKCGRCGKKLFRLVPENDYGLIRTMRIEKIVDHKYHQISNFSGEYLCMDCYEKLEICHENGHKVAETV